MKNGNEKGPSQRSNPADEPEFQFTEADFQAIAQELGVPCTAGVKNQIVTVAEGYVSIKDYWENREDTAEVRTDNVKISKQARKLYESLKKLSPLGRAVFNQALPDFERTIGGIFRLQEAAEKEAQHLRFVKRGPTKNAPLLMYIIMLAAIYYEHTSRTPGISSDPWKDHVRGGPFLHFVIANLRAVEPDLVTSEQDEQRIGELIKNNLDLIKSHPK